jgi:NADPH:quinone reductase-like Zn-dependent oxidoreductase
MAHENGSTVAKAAGAVGQALLALGKMAGLDLWGTARGEHTPLVRELGATPIDYQRADFARVLPGGFDVVFDGIGEDGYRRSFVALKRGGLLCAYGYTAGVRAQRRIFTMLTWVARLYLWRWWPGGKRTRAYSINVMRALHPAWFGEDLEQLFGLLATRAIRPRVAERFFRRGRRGAPPSRSKRSHGQARPVPGPPVAALTGAGRAQLFPIGILFSAFTAIRKPE